jgi:hypothetical protein
MMDTHFGPCQILTKYKHSFGEETQKEESTWKT